MIGNNILEGLNQNKAIDPFNPSATLSHQTNVYKAQNGLILKRQYLNKVMNCRLHFNY